MKKYLVFIALALVLACGRIDKQYSKILSENSTQTTTVQCATLFGIPYLCLVKKDTDTDVIEYIDVIEYVTVIEFIEVIVEKTVIEERIEYVPYEVIVEKFVEKAENVNAPYSLPQAVADAVVIVKEEVPQQYVSNATPQSVVTSVIDYIPEIVTSLPPPPPPIVTLPPPPSVTKLPPPPTVVVKNPKSRVENPSAEEAAALIEGHWSSHSHNDGSMVSGSDGWDYDAIGNLGDDARINHAHSGGTTGYIVENGNIRHARSRDRNETPDKVQRLVVHGHSKADWEGNYR